MDGGTIAFIVIQLALWIPLVKDLIDGIKEMRLAKKCQGRVDAKIIKVIDNSFCSWRWGKVERYFPIYQYVVDGVMYEKETSWEFRYKRTEGEKVILCYDESDPECFTDRTMLGWKREVTRAAVGVFLWLFCWGAVLIHDLFLVK